MIVALAGRRIDAPDADQTRFPLKNIDVVREKLSILFSQLNPDVLICSGACGADLLALQVAGEMGIRRHMILPFEPALFRQRSVADRPGNWGILFDRICMDIKDKEKLEILHYAESGEVYEMTNIEIIKKAVSISQKFDHVRDVKVVLAWEGASKDEADATAHFKNEAEKRGIKIEEINTLK